MFTERLTFHWRFALKSSCSLNKIVEKVVYLGHVFGIWEVFFGFWEVFWIPGIVLDSGSVFGFWKVFWILGIVWDSGGVFGFWKLFWILGSVLSSRATGVNPLIRLFNFLFLNIKRAMVAIVIYRQPHHSVEGTVLLGLIRLM